MEEYKEDIDRYEFRFRTEVDNIISYKLTTNLKIEILKQAITRMEKTIKFLDGKSYITHH